MKINQATTLYLRNDIRARLQSYVDRVIEESSKKDINFAGIVRDVLNAGLDTIERRRRRQQLVA